MQSPPWIRTRRRTAGPWTRPRRRRRGHVRRRRGGLVARWASRVPSNVAGSTPLMRCISSLHWTAPLATSHSQPPGVSEGFRVAQPRTRFRPEPTASRRCSVRSRATPTTRVPTSRPHRRPAATTGRSGSRMPSRRATSVWTWSTCAAAGDGVEQDDDVVADVLREQIEHRCADDVRRAAGRSCARRCGSSRRCDPSVVLADQGFRATPRRTPRGPPAGSVRPPCRPAVRS